MTDTIHEHDTMQIYLSVYNLIATVQYMCFCKWNERKKIFSFLFAVKKIMIQQEELKDEVRHNRKMMSVVLAMLKKHEEVIPEMDTLDIRLPVSSIMEFDELEERLKDAAFRKTMVRHFIVKYKTNHKTFMKEKNMFLTSNWSVPTA